MKKADNFNAGKWLTENKITTQSRLNEADSRSLDKIEQDLNMIMKSNINNDEKDKKIVSLEKIYRQKGGKKTLEKIATKKPSIKVLKDIYYFDKLSGLSAKDDVDEKYHDKAKLVFKKGKTVKDDTDYDDSEYEMITTSKRLTKGTDYSI